MNWILDEHNTFGFLRPDTRKKFVKHLIVFIHEEYGPDPSKKNIATSCHAAIILFPSLKVERSVIGGIVSSI